MAIDATTEICCCVTFSVRTYDARIKLIVPQIGARPTEGQQNTNPLSLTGFKARRSDLSAKLFP